ncbi:hypothetical protein [Streptomyces sp. SID13588]|uniref:hypothetical protein n=1 Tax=Streptomyces sp. SID13588 TaxID=2706051 RepID=UPI0013C93C83|nr:hypothetical protein [Streptomyces sp. SID13588]NEA72743.1 hypothetical protein [Streptomyces sp. SID13588]
MTGAERQNLPDHHDPDLPRRTPGDLIRGRYLAEAGWRAFGVPSPALAARSERGLTRFLRREPQGRPDEVGGEA